MFTSRIEATMEGDLQRTRQIETLIDVHPYVDINFGVHPISYTFIKLMFCT